MTTKKWTEYVPQNTGFTTTSWFDTPLNTYASYEEAAKKNLWYKAKNDVPSMRFRVLKRTVIEEVVNS